MSGNWNGSLPAPGWSLEDADHALVGIAAAVDHGEQVGRQGRAIGAGHEQRVAGAAAAFDVHQQVRRQEEAGADRRIGQGGRLRRNGSHMERVVAQQALSGGHLHRDVQVTDLSGTPPGFCVGTPNDAVGRIDRDHVVAAGADDHDLVGRVAWPTTVKVLWPAP